MKCTLPFDGFFVNAMGKFSPCCALSVMNEDSNEESSITIDMDGDFINHERMVELRKEHASCDIKNQTCIDCIARYKGSDTFNSDLVSGELPDTYDADTGRISTPDFKHLNVAFSNRCNLACRMCSSMNSNKFGEMMHNKIRLQDIIYLSDQWYNEENPGKVNNAFDDDSLGYLIEHSQNTDTITIHGGEPFLEPRVVQFLDSVKKTKKLYITTNGTRKPRQTIIDAINNNNSGIMFSIEGTKDVQEYVRIGSKMSDIWDNIAYIREKCPSAEFYTNTVVTAYNWLDLADFIRLAPEFSKFGVVNMFLDWNATYSHIDFFHVLSEEDFNEGKSRLTRVMYDIHHMDIPERLKQSCRKSVQQFVHAKYQPNERLKGHFNEYNKQVDDL
ncbi:radical SAM domain-containing protein [Vibrio phage K567]